MGDGHPCPFWYGPESLYPPTLFPKAVARSLPKEVPLSLDSLLDRRPGKLLRALFRLPIWLYRLHLGFLLGNRFLLLTHIGRKSGLARQTVREVVRYDPTSKVCVVASGWGEASNWLRNIGKTPDVRVTLRTRRSGATAVRLSPDEVQQELMDYARRYALAFRRLATAKLRPVPQDEAEACRSLARVIPLFALQPVQN